MEPVLFESSSISLACISDTLNDFSTKHVPKADIFLHAGNMTDSGSYDELEKAYRWIVALPHRVKVVISGNHDIGLDPVHPSYSQEAHSLFTSLKAQKAGLFYIDREVCEIARFYTADGSIKPLRVYGNPCQPDSGKTDFSFTYQPHPDPSALRAWKTAPVCLDQASAEIWLLQCPPKARLDTAPKPPLTGCEVLSRCVARARPLVAVFGHYPSGNGVEKVTWDLMEDKVNLSEMLSEELKGHDFDLSAPDMLDKDLNTLCVNAAWMTMDRARRNMPWCIKVNFDTSEN